MTEEKKNAGTDVIIPASLTDLVKALREMIELCRDVAGVWIDISGAVDHHKARGAAHSLDVLAFLPQGSRQHLDRLAGGAGTAEDVHAIGMIMERTAEPVEKAIDQLGQYRDALREHVGMNAAQLLDEIIYGPVGKRQLRHVLDQLAAHGARGDRVRDRVPELAQSALDHIEKLNGQVAQLHDQILQLGKKK